jgi:hypothetical protein
LAFPLAQIATALFGPGKQFPESVGDGGVKTQVYEYTTTNRLSKSLT